MRFSHCTLKVFKTGFKPTREHDFRFRLCETYPARLAVVGTVILIFAGVAAAARDPGEEAYMIRMLACKGPDAKMEVYLPQSAVFGHNGRVRRVNHSVIGYYALDLTQENKGKPLEPVRISFSPDRKTVVVNQYTRGLPPTRIPVAGGTVDFDHRFGTGAKCGRFGRGSH